VGLGNSLSRTDPIFFTAGIKNEIEDGSVVKLKGKINNLSRNF
jgi:hypothetical protein